MRGRRVECRGTWKRISGRRSGHGLGLGHPSRNVPSSEHEETHLHNCISSSLFSDACAPARPTTSLMASASDVLVSVLLVVVSSSWLRCGRGMGDG